MLDGLTIAQYVSSDMSERDRGDRPKKSWREMDAARDRPRPPRDDRGREPARPGTGGGMDARASKQYRAALDALFEKGEVGKIAEKLSGGPGASRVDPVDVVHGRSTAPASERPSPASERSSVSERPGSGERGSGGSDREPASSARTPAPPPPPAKEDGRAAMRKKIIEALGRDEISRAIDRYVKALGWPNDFEILEQALEHNKAERQAEAMEQLDKLLAREKPKRSRTLAGKLRFIEETSDSSDLREQAARIRAKL
jgi:hypothetical protein